MNRSGAAHFKSKRGRAARYVVIGGVAISALAVFLAVKLIQRPAAPGPIEAEVCQVSDGHLNFQIQEVDLVDCPTGWGCTPVYQCTAPFYEIHPDQDTESFLSYYSCTGGYVCCRTVSQTPTPTPTPEPPGGWSPSWCGQYDLSGDNLVDIDDFGKGRACINNPGCGVPVPGRLGTSNWAEVDPDQFMDDLRACFGKTGS